MIAVLVARTGVELVISGTRVLVDVAIPEREVQIVHEVLDGTAEIRGWHRLRARRAGATRHIDLHLLVDPSMSVARAHEITDQIEATLEQRLGGADVVIHIEPATNVPGGGRGAAVNHGRGSADEGPSRPFKELPCAASSSRSSLCSPRADRRRLRLGDERLPRQGGRRPAEVRGADDRPDDEGHDRHQHESGGGVGVADAARHGRQPFAGDVADVKPPADKQPLADQLVGAYRTLAKASLDLKAALDAKDQAALTKALEEFNKATADESAADRRVQRRRLGVAASDTHVPERWPSG